MVEFTSNGFADGPDRRYREAFGRKNGLLQSASVQLFAADGPDGLHIAGVDVADLRPVVGSEVPGVEAAGKAPSLEAAMNAGVGEAVERCTFQLPRERDLVWESYAELSDRARTVDFSYLDIYDGASDTEQFEPFDETTELPWVSGTNLLTGEPVFVPAERIWYPSGPLDGGPRHLRGTSTGLAAGSSRTMALVNSLYEAIERDGIMRTWYCQRSPTELVPSDRFESLWVTLEDDFETERRSLHLFDFETSVDVPVVGAILGRGPDEFPAFVHGAGTHLDPATAMHDAAVEAAQTLPYAYQMLLKRGSNGVDPQSAGPFKSNVLYYSLPDNFEEVRFYFEGDSGPAANLESRFAAAPGTEPSLEAQYARLLAALDRADVTPVAVDVTSTTAAELGIAVTKVVVPELVPYGSPTAPPTGHPEIEDDVATTRAHPFP